MATPKKKYDNYLLKFSIITAAYNSANTIGDTIQSIHGQNYDNIEHIVIDGGSTDETCEIVRRHAPDAVLTSGPDNGIYDAMNKGIALATGDVIGILNSDDYYASPEVIAKVAEVMEASGVDTVYGDLNYVNKRAVDKVVRKWVAGRFKHKKFEWGWMPPHPTFFVRKHVYEKYGYFNTDLRTSADYELMLRLLYKHGVSTSYVPSVLVHMRTGGQSNVSLKNRLKANREDRKAWKALGLKPKFFTVSLKPFRKITQYFRK